MFRSEIRKAIKQVSAYSNFSVEASDNPAHGDYYSNAALVAAKSSGKSPRELAKELRQKLLSSPKFDERVERIEIAGPGFLNFFIKKEFLQKSLPEVLKKNLGVLNPKSYGLNLNLEFVSANPTGPLTMANGRGGFYGDVLANVLEAAGKKVTREFYINDAGNQIKLLEESIAGRGEHYKGEYIKKLKGKTGKQAIAEVLKWIKKSLKNAGIKFDVWFSEEKKLRKKGELKKTLAFLKKRGLVEYKDGAVWLKLFINDKKFARSDLQGKSDLGQNDAVLIKSDGEPTYFLSDLAYHYDKFLKRKFDLAINVWGADHHGYALRMQKGIEALGIEPKRLRIIVMQLVRLVRKGKEVRMSKRAGEFVTLDDLIDSVGVDAARWFFLEKSPDTHMDFDLDLAKERSKKNPVYYVQYASARCGGILRKSKNQIRTSDVHKLEATEELRLIKKMLQLPEIIEDISNDYQVQRLTKYTYELAQTFTDFYEKHRVISSYEELTRARLLLVEAAQKTLARCLRLMGIAAPNKM